MDVERLNIIKLSRTKGFSNLLFHKSLTIYGSATNIVNNIHNIGKKNIILPTDDEIQAEFENCEKNNIKIITYIDDIYPKLLSNISSFPLTLSCKGNLDLFKSERNLAIVGSRNSSLNDFNYTKKISREISNYGYIIVSGMAKGIDAAAHNGALENGTIAILGGGVDNIYPKENEYLYYEILDNNGLILSEFNFSSAPKAEHFPMRNRIIIGLSRGVLVVNAGRISGTLHTANQALEYGRELLVFPGSPYDERCVGSNKLLQDGANLVLDTKDIIEIIETFMPTNNSLVFENKKRNTDVKNNIKNVEEKIDIENYNFGKLTHFEENEEDKKNDIESVILSKLNFVPLLINDLLSNLTSYNLNEINSTIIKLQLKNEVVIENGKIYLNNIKK